MEIIEKRQRIADRRTKEIDYKRRKFIRRGKVFTFEREIYLSDTNAYRNVYFANYLIFIGEAREDLLQWLLGDNVNSFMMSGIGMVTVDVSIKYKLPLYCFDRIKINITVPKLTRMKLCFKFEILNSKTKNIHAIADMTIGAVQGDKVTPLPEALTIPIRKNFL